MKKTKKTTTLYKKEQKVYVSHRTGSMAREVKRRGRKIWFQLRRGTRGRYQKEVLVEDMSVFEEEFSPRA